MVSQFFASAVVHSVCKQLPGHSKNRRLTWIRGGLIAASVIFAATFGKVPRPPAIRSYIESPPRDNVVGDKFDAYSFSGHKRKVIDLLKRATRVSVETQCRGRNESCFFTLKVHANQAASHR